MLDNAERAELANKLARNGDQSAKRVVSHHLEHRQTASSTTVHVYKHHLNTTGFHHTEVGKSVSSIRLPELSDKDSDHFSWYRTYFQDLRVILEKARNENLSRELTKKDMEGLLLFCKQEGWAFFSDKDQRLKKTLRVLSYIAAHRYAIPDDILITIARHVDRVSQDTLDDKYVKYAALTFGHVLLHRSKQLKPAIQDAIGVSLEKLLNHLKANHKAEHLITLVIVLSALAKKGRALKQEEIDILKYVLVDVSSDDEHAFYNRTDKKAAKDDGQSSSTVITSRFLSNIKKHTKEGKALSLKELSAMEWGRDTAKNTKIIRAIRQAVFQGQTDILSNENARKILKEGLRDLERKIKEDAIAALNHAKKNEVSIGDLSDDLSRGLVDVRVCALDGIVLHLQNNQEAAKESEAQWLPIFENLKKFPELRDGINRAKFLIHGKAEHLKDALLNKESCVEASETFLNEAKNSVEFGNDVLLNLAKLASDLSFPKEARVNAISALAYSAKKSRSFPAEVMLLINTLFSSDDTLILNTLCEFLGNYSEENIKQMIVFEKISERHFFEWIDSFLSNTDLVYNASILFSHVASLESTKKDCLDKWQRLIVKVVKKVCSNTLSDDVKTNLLSGLLVISDGCVNYFCSEEIISDLNTALIINCDDDIKHALVTMLGRLLDSSTVAQFTPAITDTLIQLLKNADEKIKEDAGHLLIDYIEKGNVRFGQEVEDTLFELLRTEETLKVLICNILVLLSDKRHVFNKKNLLNMIETISGNYQSTEVQVFISKILKSLDEINLSPEIAKELLDCLASEEPEIIENVLFCFQKAIKKPENVEALKRSSKITESLSCLVAIVLNERLEPGARVDALKLLTTINLKIDLIELENVGALLKGLDGDIDEAICKFIDIQLLQHSVSIANCNESISNILNNLADCLESDTLILHGIKCLLTIVNSNGQLSEKILLKLVSVVTNHDSNTVRAQALAILKGCVAKGIKNDKVTRIVDFEKAISKLNKFQPTEAVNEINRFVLQGQFFTVNSFDELSRLPLNNLMTLQAISEVLILVIQCGQTVPPKLVEKVCQSIVHFISIRELVPESSLLFLAKLSDKNEYLGDEIYFHCSNWFFSRETDAIRMSSILSLYRVYAKYKRIIDKRLINAIFSLCDRYNDNEQELEKVLEILYCTALKNKDINISAEKLVKLLPKVKRNVNKEKIILLLDLLIPSSNINKAEKHIPIWINVLEKAEDLSLIEKILLKLEQVPYHFSDEENRVIEVKNAERILLNENSEMKDKMVAINSLNKNDYPLNERLVQVYIELLNRLVLNETEISKHRLTLFIGAVSKLIFSENVCQNHQNKLSQLSMALMALLGRYKNHDNFLKALKNMQAFLEPTSEAYKRVELLLVTGDISLEHIERLQVEKLPVPSDVLNKLIEKLFDFTEEVRETVVDILTVENHAISQEGADKLFANFMNYLNEANKNFVSAELVCLVEQMLDKCSNDLLDSVRESVMKTPQLRKIFFQKSCLFLVNKLFSDDYMVKRKDQVVYELMSLFFGQSDEQFQLEILSCVESLCFSKLDFNEGLIKVFVDILTDDYTYPIRQRVCEILTYIKLVSESDFNVAKPFLNAKNMSDMDGLMYGLTKNGKEQESIFRNILMREFKRKSPISLNNEKAFYSLIEQFSEKIKCHFLFKLLVKQRDENLSIEEGIEITYIMLDMGYEPDSSYILLRGDVVDIRWRWLKQKIVQCDAECVDALLIEQTVNSCMNCGWSPSFVIQFFKSLNKKLEMKSLLRFFNFIKNHAVNEETFKKRILSDISSLVELENEIKSDSLKLRLNRMADQFYQRFFRVKFSDQLIFHKKKILHELTQQLLNLGWSEYRLLKGMEVFLIANQEDFGFNDLLLLLQDSCIYRVTEQDFLSCLEEKNIIENFNKLIRDTYNLKTGELKTVETLLPELYKINQEYLESDEKYLNELLQEEDLKQFLDEVKEMKLCKEGYKSGFLGVDNKPISDWDIGDIQLWAIRFSEKKFNVDALQTVLPEMLAVISQACERYSDVPRDTQLLAVKLLLSPKPNLGRFAQIATGEGKSLTIAILAIVKCLLNERVDIVTSSPILAKHDVKKYQPLYDCFGLKAASNEEKFDKKGVKACYKDDVHIVYGDANNFEFDFLRDKYSGLGTRGKRPYQAVILDEVDNLLIEGNDKIAMLSNSNPGMNSLNPIFIFLWHQLQFLIKRENEKRIREGKKTLSQSNYQDVYDYLVKNLDKDLSEILSMDDEVDSKKINIPKHLKEFVKEEKAVWIRNAIYARFRYHFEHHYEIKIDSQRRRVVVPIDHANTGILQKGTLLNDGLQQFLHIKEGLSIVTYQITKNYFSNRALIKLYGKNIIGMTGTLGTVHSKQFLKEAYSVDLINIPTHKEKKLKDFPDVLAGSKEIWLDEIVNRVLHEHRRGRAILVICESIDSVNEIEEEVRKRVWDKKIYTYKEDDAGQEEFLKTPFSAGSILIATNLASRGTDIKITGEVLNNGGLHVCCTFLPENQRVEDQIFGRAARKGEIGSANLVLNKSNLFGEDLSRYKLANVAEVKNVRNDIEKIVSSDIKDKDLIRIAYKDALFACYLKFLEKLNQWDLNDTSYEDQLHKWDIDISPHVLKQTNIFFKRASLEEHWGFWIKRLNVDELLNKAQNEKPVDELTEEQFEVFSKEFEERYKNNTIIQNPNYFISQGNAFLKQASGWFAQKNKLYQLAIKSFEQAIALDSNAYLAYYGRAYALLMLRSENYKNEARADLERCNTIINQVVFPAEFSSSSLLSNIKNYYSTIKMSNDVSQQSSSNLEVIQLLSQSVNLAIDEIDKSKRLIDVEIEDKETQNSRYFSGLDTPEAIKAVDGLMKGDFFVSLNHMHSYIDIVDKYINSSYDVIGTYQELLEFQKKQSNLLAKATVVFHSDRVTLAGHSKKAIFKKLLPRNRKVDIAQFEEVSSIGEASASKKLGQVIGIVKSVISAPVKGGAELVKKTYFNYGALDALPVSIALENMDLDSASQVINAQEGEGFVNLVIKNVDVFLLYYLNNKWSNVASCYTLIPLKETDETPEYQLKQRAILPFDIKMEASIELKNIPYVQAKEILNKVKEFNENRTQELRVSESALLEIDVEFNQVSQEVAEKIIDQAKTDLKLTYKELTEETFIPLVHFSRKQHENARFKFSNITQKDAKHLVENAKRPNREMVVSTRPVETDFSKLNLSCMDIDEFKSLGYLYFYDVKEKAR